MSSPCGPEHAPVGDVGAALLMVDSRLQAIRAGSTGNDPEQQLLLDQFISSLGPEGVDDVLNGTCTIIYMFMQWLRMVHDDQGKDVIEYVVPTLVASLRMMPKSIPPETIPTMAGLAIAGGTGLSPSLWREQYGSWTYDEMNPLEATAFLLAEHINRVTSDPDFATRLISSALAETDED
ncbi:hypothetical protein NX794_19685 [Streptomyces sp. LP11]|uniref:Uncharacterized protein n=1 Tax=Streptomyces pyxinicus TaxID=2970331 RepID=A0ABT2B4I5_9ACTN|nr:hypothetical protein [Streptomyces sp. LP11]MCS0603419.1 hypothetical protein [Streptomyces sp. LP11]